MTELMTEEDERRYEVVVNHEEQYSIWPVEQPVPDGWRTVGKAGTKSECLDHIDEVWTDMRPLSLRRFMEEHADDPPQESEPEDEGPSLVDRLCEGSHPVEASLRPERSPAALKEAIDRGYVFIRFTDTQGGTELGVRVDPEASDWSGADFEEGTGQVRIAGTLTLDFEPVRCLARIDLPSLTGEGNLERVDV